MQLPAVVANMTSITRFAKNNHVDIRTIFWPYKAIRRLEKSRTLYRYSSGLQAVGISVHG